MDGARRDVRTSEGVIEVRIFTPDAGGPWPAIVMYMDAFGLRPALDGMAQRLASHGYVVALPNLYYRSGAYAPFDSAQVFSEGPERTRFKAMIASIGPAMIMRDTTAVIEDLDTLSSVRTRAPTGAVGYCMGGGYALTALATFPDRITAAASFHGGSLATDKPDSPHLLAPKMRGRLYVGVAAIDPSFPPEQKERLKAALEAAGVRHTIETYEGAKHGFAVTGHPVYDREASERHWDRLVGFFDGLA